MNKKLLSILLMSSSLAMITSCGETPTSSSSSTSQSTTESSSESTVSSSVSESTTDSSTVSSSEDSGSSSEVVDEHPTIVELDRYVWVVGETIEKANVKAFDVWSDELESYSKLVGSRFTVSEFPEVCPNGPVEITLAAGRKTGKTTVYYYENAQKAAELTEIAEDQTPSFVESRYIRNNKLVTSTNEFNGKLYVAEKSINIALSKVNVKLVDPVWTVNMVEGWTEDGGTPAVYDPTYNTIPHLMLEDVIYPNATYSPGRTENPTVAPISKNDTLNNIEVYVDADGHIAYMGKNVYEDTTNIDITGDTGYWSYYKDYTKNPAIILGADFDANDPVKKYHFEKVIPHGGFAFIAYCVGGAESYSGGKTVIADIYDKITAQSGAVYYSDTFKLDFTKKANGGEASEEEIAKENALMAALFTSVKTRTQLQLNLAALANTYQTYAYYKVNAIASKNQDLINKGDEVLASINKQTLPQIENEPILLKYFDALTLQLMEEWKAMFE